MLPHLVYKLDAFPDMTAFDDEQSNDNTRSTLGSRTNNTNVQRVHKMD